MAVTNSAQLARPSTRWLRQIRNAMAAGFIVSFVAMTGIPTSILQISDIPGKRIDPVNDNLVGFQIPAELGGLHIEKNFQYGCVRFHPPGGPVSEPLCNRHMHCHDGPITPGTRSHHEIYQFPNSNVFLLQLGSACNSACCDFRGTTFTAQGQRLDDRLQDRIWLRFGYLGLEMSLFAMLCLGLSLRSRAGTFSRVATILSFAACTALLWWNL